MTLLQRARDSGVCPPTLLEESRVDNGFEEAVSKILDTNGFSLGSGGDVVENFKTVMQMAERSDQVSKEVLEFRRCIILTIVGSTDVTSASLKGVLESGYLNTVKTWFDDILNGSVGAVDLLLQLLTNIKDLPVTKSLVKQSGMGKAIGSIEKHSICAGTPNETAIMDRVQGIKSAWNASVKARKEKDGNGEKAAVPKRQIESPTNPTVAKKAKVEEKKKSNAFSSLLRKVSDTSSSKGAAAASSTGKSPTTAGANSTGDAETKQGSKKSSKARVKWADHFGGNLTASRVIDSTDMSSDGTKPEDTSVSWTDRKKRDRLREKELLAKAKKAKLLDDDDDDAPEPLSRMKPTREWRQPSMLPENPDVTKAQLSSKEIAVQVDRMTKVQPARYVSDEDVPSSPAPLSDVEQALDMTSVSSAVVANMPFFVPQTEAPAPAAVAPAPSVPPPAASYAPPHHNIPQVPPPSGALASTYPPQPQNGHEAATAQTVQSLGLPLFLVGQNVQALQTLASSPSLLNTLVEPNGMYDQPRLMSLVQTLSQNIAPSQPAQVGGLPGYQPAAPAPAYGGQSYPPTGQGGGIYGPASSSTNPAAAYGQGPSSSFGGGFAAGGPAAGPGGRPVGYRGDNNSDGNLHLSGYGPATTQADIIQLFAPYVIVDEVVMKGTFSFVNTSDPMGAKNAREALNGALLGGTPIRINMAQRRNRDPNRPGPPGPGPGPGFGGPPARGADGPALPVPGAPPPVRPPRNDMPPFQSQAPPAFGGVQNEDMVRDDRGNPATKNLFVAGYGPGTTEQTLRDVFGQYATIIGVITKGTFSFVNTSDKGAAIRAREALSNSMINGGVLRINFAKETGRLGTSFDLTYGPGAGPGGPGGPGGGGGGGHYGRGGF